MSDLDFSWFILSMLFSFAGLFFISALLHRARCDRKAFFEEAARNNGPLSIYRHIHRIIFRNESLESLLCSLSFSQQTLRTSTIACGIAIYSRQESTTTLAGEYLAGFGFFLALVLALIALSDLIPRAWAQKSPATLMQVALQPASLFLILLSPITALLFFVFKLFFNDLALTLFREQKRPISDLIHDLEDETTISDHDRRLISSVFSFRKRVAREIMQPRVDLFCIPDSMTIEDAAQKMLQEGYSRVPVYHGTIDTIIGIIFYKDLLAHYVTPHSAPGKSSETPKLVKSIVKKAFYCPETKTISSLLQEFRKKQVHFAVVVDEYGGTSGVVTIEDILEEIVGEIADEYDDNEMSYRKGPGGSWIVDAQLSLHDISDELGIDIPQGDDYDTLAGYIFFRLGSIPKSGSVLYHDRFELKILKSNDRMVEEVLITPVSAHQRKQIEADASDST